MGVHIGVGGPHKGHSHKADPRPMVMLHRRSRCVSKPAIFVGSAGTPVSAPEIRSPTCISRAWRPALSSGAEPADCPKEN
jgi:hypothetical protein